MNNSMKDFAFTVVTGASNKTFIISATDKAVATAIFANKIRGRHGFSPETTFDDVKSDIEAGNIEVGVLTHLE